MNLNIFKCEVDGIRTQKALWRFVQSLICSKFDTKLATWPLSFGLWLFFCGSVKSISTETTFLHKITQYFFHSKAIDIIDR